jgi:hypothetical protein
MASPDRRTQQKGDNHSRCDLFEMFPESFRYNGGYYGSAGFVASLPKAPRPGRRISFS